MGIRGDSLRGRFQAKASSLNSCISPRLDPVSLACTLEDTHSLQQVGVTGSQEWERKLAIPILKSCSHRTYKNKILSQKSISKRTGVEVSSYYQVNRKSY